MGYDGFWKKLMEDMNAVTALPLVELAGAGRLLIENHRGITGYSRERIAVKMSYGSIEITGDCLELTQITQQQLIVTGKITALTLFQGGE